MWESITKIVGVIPTGVWYALVAIVGAAMVGYFSLAVITIVRGGKADLRKGEFETDPELEPKPAEEKGGEK